MGPLNRKAEFAGNISNHLEGRFPEFLHDIHEVGSTTGFKQQQGRCCSGKKRFQDFQSYAFAEESLLPGGTSPILSTTFDDLEPL
jgi:hypothetical protein